MNWNSAIRPLRTRTVMVAGATAVVVAALAVTLPGNADATPATGPRPTIVLEHGAFADASSWNGVIQNLKKKGYPVIAAANPLRSPASDAAYLRSVLNRIDGPVVLVGHSYGGTVITDAAVGQDNVKALVYIAAFIPDIGETSLGLSNKYPGSTLGNVLEQATYTLPDGTTGTDLTIKPDKFRAQFAADVSAKDAVLMATTQRPIAAAALEEETTRTAWKTIPSWSLIATQDNNIPPAAQRYMSERAGSHTTEVKASHAVAASRPDTVTRLIEQAAHTAK
ncbi:alpha/beta fold hydrolase [Streptomyces sp. NBC_00568]|uniref:alpha/beta fold hydrolase n=1 Tax=Streptomyces sp. NBC_00568 TaxID=2975779 RepID=UPI00224FBBEF|nr:alpha/beta hydrolase [Streptomyces sp. NBC_00568]MCX4993507.1 alpha/beta hydrolase [Streptomyces sp. NBC_00568]